MALQNDGNQSWTILEGYFLSDGSLNGEKMPNIEFIDYAAIVPEAATITMNMNAIVAPSGGADGDIWYNAGEDTPAGTGGLYKKILGAWTKLTNRVTNIYYTKPIVNQGDCPLPSAPTNFNVRIVNDSNFVKILSSSYLINGVGQKYPFGAVLPKSAQTILVPDDTYNIFLVTDGTSPTRYGNCTGQSEQSGGANFTAIWSGVAVSLASPIQISLSDTP